MYRDLIAGFLKCLYLSTGLRGFTAKKMLIFLVTVYKLEILRV